MLKKAKAETNEVDPIADVKELAQGVLDSSRQIWLAGLGAFSQAPKEGMRVFERLVHQGERLESRTRRAAVDTAAMAKGAATAKAKEMQAMAGGTWDKLEQVFEDRVAKALSKLGVHTRSDVERLTERVDALSEAVNRLITAQGGTAARKVAARAQKAGPKATPGAKRGAVKRKAAKGGKPAGE